MIGVYLDDKSTDQESYQETEYMYNPPMRNAGGSWAKNNEK